MMKLGKLYGYNRGYPLVHIHRVFPFQCVGDVKPILFYSIYDLIEFNMLRPS